MSDDTVAYGNLLTKVLQITDCIPELDNDLCGEEKCPVPMPHCSECIAKRILELI